MAGCGDASASIATSPCQHNNPRFLPVCAEALERHFRQVATSVFHHLKEIRSCLLDGNPIHLTHLSSCKSRNLFVRVSEKVWIFHRSSVRFRSNAVRSATFHHPSTQRLEHPWPRFLVSLFESSSRKRERGKSQFCARTF